MPESTKARIINDLIEESVYGPRGSETHPSLRKRLGGFQIDRFAASPHRGA